MVKINWPPQPLPVSPAKPKVAAVVAEDPKVVAARKNKKRNPIDDHQIRCDRFYSY